jgi:CHAT domain-containing protein/tetratricopeptide (TPR) repeat protein
VVRWLVVLLLGLLGGSASAEEPAPYSSVPELDEILEAVQKGGSEGTWDWVLSQGLDPWQITEALGPKRRPALATKLATAGLTRDGDDLLRYVNETIGTPIAAWQAFRESIRLRDKGELKQALENLPSISSTSATVTDVSVLQVKASLLVAQDEPAKARVALEQAAKSAFLLGWDRGQLESKLALLALLPTDGSVAQERRLLAEILRLDSDATNLGRSAQLAARLGNIEIGRAPRVAQNWLLEARALFEAADHTTRADAKLFRARVDGLIALSDAQAQSGELSEALRSALEARELTKGEAPADLRASALRSEAEILWVLGRLDDAASRLERAAGIYKDLANPNYTTVLGNLARIRVEQGRFVEADKLYAEVLESPTVKSDKIHYLTARLHAAAAILDRPAADRTIRAVKLAYLELQQAAKDADTGNEGNQSVAEFAHYADCLAARALNHLEEHKQAELLLRELLARDFVVGIPELGAFVKRELALAVAARGQPEEALELAAQGLSVFEEQIASVPHSFGLSILTLKNYRDLVSVAIEAAFDLGDPSRLRRIVERTRGIAFSIEVARRRRLRARGLRPSDPNQLRLSAGVAEAAQEYYQARATGDGRKIIAARNALWDARARLRQLEERIEIEATPAASAEWLRSVLYDDPGPILGSKEAVLYLVKTASRFQAVLDWRGRIAWWDLGPQEKVLDRAAAFVRSLRQAGSPVALDKAAAAVLPSKLLALLAEQAASGPAHIYISVSGPLARVPWGTALLLASDSSGFPPPTVSRISSQRVLRHLRTWTQRDAGGPILAIGDPDYTTSNSERVKMYFLGPLTRLPNTKDEVLEIVKPQKGDKSLLGQEATESAIDSALSSGEYPFHVLHFACHGVLYRKVPWLSALALHATPQDDGLLTVEEVSRWSFFMGPRLVVLAACESGLGVTVPGEGEEGLVRAFHLAGAREVVASLWRVGDEATKELMTIFHRIRREKRLPAVAALRMAQLEMRTHTNTRFRSPRAWSGWAVWGPQD